MSALDNLRDFEKTWQGLHSRRHDLGEIGDLVNKSETLLYNRGGLTEDHIYTTVFAALRLEAEQTLAALKDEVAG